MYIRSCTKLSKMRAIISFFFIAIFCGTSAAQEDDLQAKKDSLIQNDSLFQIAEAERHYNLGVSLMQKNENPRAIDAFNLALSIMPDFVVASLIGVWLTFQ